jgi:hypothetical protein
MTVPFPVIKPSKREFRVGAFPVKTYRALSGATVKRSFGNRPYGYELGLEFQNIPDATTTLILQHYTNTSGGFERFTLPSQLFAGMDATLQSYAQAPATIRWEYAEPPTVQSVIAGRSTVSVTLIGELA